MTAPHERRPLPIRARVAAMQQAQRTFPCAPSTSRGRALLLGTDGRDVIAYGNGRSVVLFNVRTKQADAFHEHTAATTVARFSPDGLLVASGDASGRVLVWSAHDTKQKSSLQLAALSSAVNDLQWAPDAKTLLVCGGDGRGRSAAAFSADKGALLGTLSGLARPGNSLDVSAGGRVVTGDDAGAVNVFDACVPFKHRFTVPDMSGGRAVNCVRFAPNSSTFSVAGKAALLYAGDGVPPTPLVGHATGSSVFCSAWSADGAQLLTVRATCACERPVRSLTFAACAGDSLALTRRFASGTRRQLVRLASSMLAKKQRSTTRKSVAPGLALTRSSVWRSAATSASSTGARASRLARSS